MCASATVHMHICVEISGKNNYHNPPIFRLITGWIGSGRPLAGSGRDGRLHASHDGILGGSGSGIGSGSGSGVLGGNGSGAGADFCSKREYVWEKEKEAVTHEVSRERR